MRSVLSVQHYAQTAIWPHSSSEPHRRLLIATAGVTTAEPFRLGEAGEFKLDADVAGMLYTYQREGVAWLFRLHTLQRGGILADDMGLGKVHKLHCAQFGRNVVD